VERGGGVVRVVLTHFNYPHILGRALVAKSKAFIALSARRHLTISQRI